MKTTIVAFSAVLALAPVFAFAAPADTEAKAVCTGEASITDYQGFSLMTDLCQSNIGSTCKIQRDDDESVFGAYECPGWRASSDDGGGDGGKVIAKQ